MGGDQITLRDIYLARQRIAGLARRTPLLHSDWLSDAAGTDVWLKPENLQETGSFKIRGAANRMLSLAPDERGRGVITVSSGNHGRAVAHVARRLSIPAVICISDRVPPVKVDAMRRLGAEVVIAGHSYDEADAESLRLGAERGLTRVEPFDDPLTIAGQGTTALEILEDLPQVDAVVVPVGGGGLISGMAVALKAADPAVRVAGVSMERAPVMIRSLEAGHPVQMEEEDTLAEALAGGIGLDNRYTFRLMQALVDDTALVSEREIAGAMAGALSREHLVVEGGGAVGIAALLAAKLPALRTGPAAARHVVVVISGGNVDASLLLRLSQPG